MKPKRTENIEPVSPTGLPEPLQKVEVPPTFQLDPSPAASAEITKLPEPEMGVGASTPIEEPEREPTTEAMGPLSEAVPFEEERRAYVERRKGPSLDWKGVERRRGGDRRFPAAVIPPEVEPPSPNPPQASVIPEAPVVAEIPIAAEPPKKISEFAQRWMRIEVIKLGVWLAVLIAAPVFTYYKLGWESSLGAFGFLTVTFFVTLFFHLNQRK